MFCLSEGASLPWTPHASFLPAGNLCPTRKAGKGVQTFMGAGGKIKDGTHGSNDSLEGGLEVTTFHSSVPTPLRGPGARTQLLGSRSSQGGPVWDVGSRQLGAPRIAGQSHPGATEGRGRVAEGAGLPEKTLLGEPRAPRGASPRSLGRAHTPC